MPPVVDRIQDLLYNADAALVKGSVCVGCVSDVGKAVSSTAVAESPLPLRERIKVRVRGSGSHTLNRERLVPYEAAGLPQI